MSQQVEKLSFSLKPRKHNEFFNQIYKRCKPVKNKVGEHCQKAVIIIKQ